jgi:hypothetical protein
MGTIEHGGIAWPVCMMMAVIAYTTGFGKSIILLTAKRPPHNGNEDFTDFLCKR